MKSRLFTAFVTASLLLPPAIARPEAEPAPQHIEEPGFSPAACETLGYIRHHVETLVGLLDQIRDAGSASRLAPAVIATREALLQLDFSAFESEDEEMLAMAASELFFRFTEQLARLDDADYYGNPMLKEHFGQPDAAPRADTLAPEPATAPESPAPEAGTESVLP